MSAVRPGPDLPGMRCIEKLGSGGFSDVYLYERDQPRIKVAVKLLKSDLLDERQRRQFAAEADVMADLAEHPYIVPVLGAGTSDDGRPYLVMRYFPPPDLGARVAKEQMSVPEALKTGIQLASAVETAHRNGIIHRDIKPANVLVSSYGVPALSDFGIAGRGDRGEDDDNLGVSMPWSPPEVLTGHSNGSAASDIYSLAATIWHLLVGRSPFAVTGDNGERALFGRILHGKVPSTGRADAPSSLDRLLQQAMSKDPAHRPRTALELARHLQRVEQEMRLARTEIVVLETDLPADEDAAAASRVPAPPSTPLAPAPVATPSGPSPDEGVTMLKRAVTVRPSTPSPAAHEALTERRPVRATPARPAAVTGEETELRPRVASPTPPPDTALHPTPTRAGVSPKVLAMAAIAVLAVAAVVIGILLSGSGERTPPSATPSAPGPTDLGNVIPAAVEPTITARAQADGVLFVAHGAPADAELRWSVRQPDNQYLAATAGPDGLLVPMTTPGTACVQLKVAVDGALTPYEKCQAWP